MVIIIYQGGGIRKGPEITTCCMIYLCKERDEHVVVVWDCDCRDLCQALKGDVAEHRNRQELEDQSVDQLRLENVAQWDPVEETK